MRRRCYWCGVELRWWQLNACRVCRFYMVWDHPSPPCAQGSRWDAPPDRLPTHSTDPHTSHTNGSQA